MLAMEQCLRMRSILKKLCSLVDGVRTNTRSSQVITLEGNLTKRGMNLLRLIATTMNLYVQSPTAYHDCELRWATG